MPGPRGGRPVRDRLKASGIYRGYARVAECPRCGREGAINSDQHECVECLARSFRATKKLPGMTKLTSQEPKGA